MTVKTVLSVFQKKVSSCLTLFALFLRPYSPAIPRIPCVSPETVLLDQVGLTNDVCCKHLFVIQ